MRPPVNSPGLSFIFLHFLYPMCLIGELSKNVFKTVLDGPKMVLIKRIVQYRLKLLSCFSTVQCWRTSRESIHNMKETQDSWLICWKGSPTAAALKLFQCWCQTRRYVSLSSNNRNTEILRGKIYIKKFLNSYK